MAVIFYNPQSSSVGATDLGAILSIAQVANGDSTNTIDRGAFTGDCAVQITNTGGAAPTVTINILGSMDGVFFYNLPYCLPATPTTFTVAAITATTTATQILYIATGTESSPFAVFRFLKLNYSAINNETLAASAWFR